MESGGSDDGGAMAVAVAARAVKPADLLAIRPTCGGCFEMLRPSAKPSRRRAVSAPPDAARGTAADKDVILKMPKDACEDWTPLGGQATPSTCGTSDSAGGSGGKRRQDDSGDEGGKRWHASDDPLRMDSMDAPTDLPDLPDLAAEHVEANTDSDVDEEGPTPHELVWRRILMEAAQAEHLELPTDSVCAGLAVGPRVLPASEETKDLGQPVRNHRRSEMPGDPVGKCQLEVELEHEEEVVAKVVSLADQADILQQDVFLFSNRRRGFPEDELSTLVAQEGDSEILVDELQSKAVNVGCCWLCWN